MRLSLDGLNVTVQRGLARVVDAVPQGAVSRVVGTSLDVDGQTLDPHLGLVLALEKRLHGRHDDATPEQRRASNRLAAKIAAGPPLQVDSVTDLEIAGAAGRLRARHYAPEHPSRRPLLVFFHGGGWVVGDLDTHDQVCRLLCRYADVQVLSVDYRLAPEHPYPAAVDDAIAAYEWAIANVDMFDAERVAVGGDSAGGNLAAVVAQHARDVGVTPPAAQLLIYPGTDSSRNRPSKDLFAEGYFLTRKQMDWYWDTYTQGASRTDPRLSPLCAESLEGLAPALVTTAAFDPLRDEGEAYAEALRDAGVPVVLRRAPGLVHGYMSMTGIHRASLDESLAVAGAFAALLDSVR
jgi:acetyl esterase